MIKTWVRLYCKVGKYLILHNIARNKLSINKFKKGKVNNQIDLHGLLEQAHVLIN